MYNVFTNKIILFNNRISSVQCSLFYMATQTRDHLAYKTTIKYPKEQFVIVIDLYLRPYA